MLLLFQVILFAKASRNVKTEPEGLVLKEVKAAIEGFVLKEVIFSEGGTVELPATYQQIDEDTPYGELVKLEEFFVAALVSSGPSDVEGNRMIVVGIKSVRTFKRMAFAKDSVKKCNLLRDALQYEDYIQRVCVQCNALVEHKAVVSPKCSYSTKVHTDSELAIAMLVPKFQDQVNSQDTLAETQNRGQRTPGGVFRFNSMRDHRRAMQLGFSEVMDRFNRSLEYSRNVYYCHLERAAEIMRHKVEETLRNLSQAPTHQPMNYATRVGIFGSNMKIVGSARATRDENSGSTCL